MGRVVHFEIHADDPQRAIAFYRSVFGWTIDELEGAPYWAIQTGPPDAPGIDGGLTNRQGEIDAPPLYAFACTVDVDDLDASMAAVEENGGTIVVGKLAIPGIGWLAAGRDTEGNVFGMMQNDESAA